MIDAAVPPVFPTLPPTPKTPLGPLLVLFALAGSLNVSESISISKLYASAENLSAA